jgi:aminoglycoside phosphotransferase family enzyme/predicted kinase
MTPLIAGLLATLPQNPPPRLIETHISWVILVGDFAYKLKKPLDLGFLDFSTLDKRRACCDAEIRLNRRLAPDIYLGVVAVAGSPDAPRFEGEGPVLEWAVKMRAFPADATLDREAEVSAEQIDAIADAVAAFHGAVDVAPADSAYGLPEMVRAPITANFEHLRALLPPPSGEPPLGEDKGRGEGARVQGASRPCSLSPSPSPEGGGELLLDRIEAWSRAEGERLADHFAARKADGYIRECHGDLHLGNIAWIPDSPPPFPKGEMKNQGRPLIFDAIEFNPDLRFIDVINEIAFLTMDLRHRGRDDLAWRCLNRYLEHTGDYAGLAALPYYQVYRAMVRAKVAAILATQRADRTNVDFGECRRYLELADRLAHDRHPALILMHGVSGSGKTWYSRQLLERLGAVRLRSDVERKRLFGLAARESSAGVPGGIYTREAGERTLARLLEQARELLTAGFSVIVDATFIRRDWRDPFARLAQELGLPWFIAAAEAPAEVLRERVAHRMVTGHDASEAGLEVLESQLAAVEPFTDTEQGHVLPLVNGVDGAIARIQVV